MLDQACAVVSFNVAKLLAGMPISQSAVVSAVSQRGQMITSLGGRQIEGLVVCMCTLDAPQTCVCVRIGRNLDADNDTDDAVADDEGNSIEPRVGPELTWILLEHQNHYLCYLVRLERRPRARVLVSLDDFPCPYRKRRAVPASRRRIGDTKVYIARERAREAR